MNVYERIINVEKQLMKYFQSISTMSMHILCMRLVSNSFLHVFAKRKIANNVRSIVYVFAEAKVR